jgi:hypothetical protein
LLLATPKTWFEKNKSKELNIINNNAMLDLNTKNYAFIDTLTENKDYVRFLHKELCYLEMDGRFEE